MAFAPEPFRSACLRVLYRATIEVRLIGYAGSDRGLSDEESRMIAAIADAVHNLPNLLQTWELVDEGLLRGTLAGFDDTWGHLASCRLLDVYESALDSV
jgi:hypothetical protein